MYDISDCALKSVPTGVYSKIKISRKEALLLNVSKDLSSKMLHQMVPFIPHATNGSTLIVPNDRNGSSNVDTTTDGIQHGSSDMPFLFPRTMSLAS